MAKFHQIQQTHSSFPVGDVLEPHKADLPETAVSRMMTQPLNSVLPDGQKLRASLMWREKLKRENGFEDLNYRATELYKRLKDDWLESGSVGPPPIYNRVVTETMRDDGYVDLPMLQLW